MVRFETLPGTANFYFLRHGQSMGNAGHVLQGQADYPLSERGRAQAAEVAAWFAGRKIDAVLSSPLQRARETAEIVASAIGCDAAECDELTEIGIGIFTGLTWAQITRHHPVEQRSFLTRSWDGVPGAEPSDALYARAARVWELLLARAQQGQCNILSVTHSGTVQWIVRVTFGTRTWLPLLPTSNCGIYQLSVDNGSIPPDAAVDQATETYRWVWELMNYHPPAR